MSFTYPFPFPPEFLFSTMTTATSQCHFDTSTKKFRMNFLIFFTWRNWCMHPHDSVSLRHFIQANNDKGSYEEFESKRD